MVLQIACSQNSTKYVRTILIAKSVNNSFVHSEENSDLNIKGQKYWVHYKRHCNLQISQYSIDAKLDS